jgi:transposase
MSTITTALQYLCRQPQTCQKLRQLEKENLTLKNENNKLKRALLKYENPHTPSAMRKYPTTPTTKTGDHTNQKTTTNQKRFPGRPKGKKGTTRQKQKTPTITKEPPPKHQCTHCKTPLHEPHKIKHHLIEEIPLRQKRQVIDYIEYQYQCPNCHTKNTAKHPECPPEGIFGVNAQCQTTLLKFAARLPFEKTAEHMNTQFDLPMTPATVLDITSRVSQTLRSNYHDLMVQIRNSPIVNIDETSIKIDGKNWWLWTFVTPTVTLYVIEPSRGKKVLEQVLGADFLGFIGCDGLRSYSNFSDRLQRCWAHLLREAKWLSERFSEAVGLYVGLKGLFSFLKDSLVGDPSLEVRRGLVLLGRRRLRYWLDKVYVGEEVRAFVKKVGNGFDFWFTFVLILGLEPTNNLAERALKEPIVQRKIMGTLRNRKGTQIYETMMSLLATWEKQGLDLHDQMAESLITTWTKS